MSAKLTSQRRISPHEGQEGGSIGPASAAASFGWRNGCASPGEGVDSCRQRSQIGNPGLVRVLQDGAVGEDALNWILDFPPHRLSLQEVVQGPMDQPVSMDDQSLMVLPGRDQEEYFLLRREAIVDGLDIEDARREIDAFGEPVVMVTFSENGAERLEEFTDSHVGEYLAIVLDGVVISAPQVQSRLGRSVMITGGADFSIREAYDLSILIGAARLPFGLASEQIEIINTQQWVWDFGLRADPHGRGDDGRPRHLNTSGGGAVWYPPLDALSAPQRSSETLRLACKIAPICLIPSPGRQFRRRFSVPRPKLA